MTTQEELTEQLDAVLLKLGETQELMFDAQRQRDKLAEALGRIAHPLWWMQEDHFKLIATKALQSIKTNKPNQQTK